MLICKKKYVLVELLGQGASGSVWKATNTLTDLPVCLKILTDSAPTAEALKRFREECRVLTRLRGSHIVRANAMDVTADGRSVMVTDFIEGKSLASLIQEEGCLPAARAMKIFDQVLEGLVQVHAAGVIHRDIKPANIMVTDTTAGDFVTIVDFGIARTLATESSQRLTREGAFPGSPPYMSPEQFQGFEASFRSDIYGFGCVMYQVLTGRVAFSGNTAYEICMQHTGADRAALLIDVPSAELRTIIGTCIEPVVENRYESASAVRADLQSVMAGGNVASERRKPIKSEIPAGASSRKSTTLSFIFLGIVVALLVATSWLYSQWQNELKSARQAYGTGGYEELERHEQSLNTFAGLVLALNKLPSACLEYLPPSFANMAIQTLNYAALAEGARSDLHSGPKTVFASILSDSHEKNLSPESKASALLLDIARIDMKLPIGKEDTRLIERAVAFPQAEIKDQISWAFQDSIFKHIQHDLLIDGSLATDTGLLPLVYDRVVPYQALLERVEKLSRNRAMHLHARCLLLKCAIMLCTTHDDQTHAELLDRELVKRISTSHILMDPDYAPLIEIAIQRLLVTHHDAEAQALLDRCTAVCKRAQNKVSLAKIYLASAEFYYSRGDVASATKYNDLARAECASSQDSNINVLIGSQLQYATLLSRAGKSAAALHECSLAKEILETKVGTTSKNEEEAVNRQNLLHLAFVTATTDLGVRMIASDPVDAAALDKYTDELVAINAKSQKPDFVVTLDFVRELFQHTQHRELGHRMALNLMYRLTAGSDQRIAALRTAILLADKVSPKSLYELVDEFARARPNDTISVNGAFLCAVRKSCERKDLDTFDKTMVRWLEFPMPDDEKLNCMATLQIQKAILLRDLKKLDDAHLWIERLRTTSLAMRNRPNAEVREKGLNFLHNYHAFLYQEAWLSRDKATGLRHATAAIDLLSGQSLASKQRQAMYAQDVMVLKGLQKLP